MKNDNSLYLDNMKTILTVFVSFMLCMQVANSQINNSMYIANQTITAAIQAVEKEGSVANKPLLEKGVRHIASLWRENDGTADEFVKFVADNYATSEASRQLLFERVCGYLESIHGRFNEITLDLRKVMDEAEGEILPLDQIFSSYSVDAHIDDDLYDNKVAFIIALNFPYYTLAEKESSCAGWSRRDWAMARLGDYFTSRVPASVNQNYNIALGNAELYINEYNIYMGKLRTDKGKQLFPDDMVLLSHWNLRDELKADYTDKTTGLAKQEMIYDVMQHIINQTIPAVVINSPEYEWIPSTNVVTKNGVTVNMASEPDTRYQRILDIFNAERVLDEYTPGMNTAILRAFSGGMEVSQEEVETLFDSYLSSPLLADVGKLIKKRLGRKLQPFDIWYDGFKTRSTISEDLLTSKTVALYPTPEAFQDGTDDILMKLGWSRERANYITSKIEVDPARGSGHAWGAGRKGAKSHLRTRIPEGGMDYKGYNIAVHEFGHNVEQTISLYDIDYYTLSGVPNTAFTEALAFVFQDRDLSLLGINSDDPEQEKLTTLDASWSLMEIMGVGMVDMAMWKWLYANPDATAGQLKEQVQKIAIEVWNKYYAPVFGVKDSPILAVYSHMVNSPLYLANYSYGQIIQFQLEEHLKGKNFASEVDRIYKLGTLTPQEWMQQAVGSKISVEPLLNLLEGALK